jgi:C_GCAxxG_C_C family probable redox protein
MSEFCKQKGEQHDATLSRACKSAQDCTRGMGELCADGTVESRETLLEGATHSEEAKNLFARGYNCAQAVFAAFCDETGLDMKTALLLSSSFGGGMGRLREVCGALTGMFMVAGIKFGYVDSKDKSAKAEHNKLIQSLALRFKERNGSYLCRQLRGISDQEAGGKEVRSCAELVEYAAEALDELINQR